MSFNKEQSTIISLVSKFRCVSMQQLYDLLPEHSHRGIQMLVAQPVKGRRLGQYVFRYERLHRPLL